MPVITKSGLWIDYDDDNKDLFIRWGKTEDYRISEDHGDIILDLDADNDIIGIELLHFDVNTKYCAKPIIKF